MAADRSKPHPIDVTAEEAVRILNVARLFEGHETSERIFAHLIECEKFAEAEKVRDPDTVFVELARDISTELIMFATNVARLQQAREWIAANELAAGRDADPLSVLAELTLVYIVNVGAKRHPQDPRWMQMKKRVEKLKSRRKAARSFTVA